MKYNGQYQQVEKQAFKVNSTPAVSGYLGI
jgi:hypothetical protein